MQNSPFHPRYLPAWLTLLILRGITLLPLSKALSLGRILGRLFNRLLPHRRLIIETNTGLCFPELSTKERENFVEKVMISMTMGIFETAYSWWASDQTILNHCKTEGFELLDEAQKTGQGVILIGAHYTTLDLAGRVIGMHQDLDITYKDQRNAAFNYVINRYRQRYFKNLIEKQQMRRMVKNLKAGRTIWYAPDQDFGREGSVFAPFFGQQAATITTIGKLVQLTGAKTLFYSHFRVEEGKKPRYLAKIHDPFADGFGSDDTINATLLNKAIEDVIRQHPEQYFWVHRRFRTRPNRSDARLYPRSKEKQDVKLDEE